MNSALQCILHCEPLTEYFRNDIYETDLNRDNPAGLDGRLALSYAHLLHDVFDERGRDSIKPANFKKTLAEFNSDFRGTEQKDALNFVDCLLNGVHEDLNRVHRKPYIERDLAFDDNPPPELLELWGQEAWLAHKRRNDSVIVDLFDGMFRSTTVCGQCNGVAATFDPFVDVTLPLPLHRM